MPFRCCSFFSVLVFAIIPDILIKATSTVFEVQTGPTCLSEVLENRQARTPQTRRLISFVLSVQLDEGSTASLEVFPDLLKENTASESTPGPLLYTPERKKGKKKARHAEAKERRRRREGKDIFLPSNPLLPFLLPFRRSASFLLSLQLLGNDCFALSSTGRADEQQHERSSRSELELIHSEQTRQHARTGNLKAKGM